MISSVDDFAQVFVVTTFPHNSHLLFFLLSFHSTPQTTTPEINNNPFNTTPKTKTNKYI